MFLINNAYADPLGGGAGLTGELMGFLPILVMFALLYFLMIRPQLKRQKETNSMLAALKKGDEVVAMGLLGRIQGLDQTTVDLEISKGVVVKVQRQAVTALLPNGTLK